MPLINSPRVALVDGRDARRVLLWRWRYDNYPPTRPYVSCCETGWMLHRFVLRLPTPEQGQRAWVIFKNGDRTDCRRGNMEVVDASTRYRVESESVERKCRRLLRQARRLVSGLQRGEAPQEGS